MPVEDNPKDRCPLCGEPNRCQRVAQGISGNQICESPCWCSEQKFPPALFDRLPDNERGQRCICRRCLQKAVGKSS